MIIKNIYNISAFVLSSHASLCALRSGISLLREAPVHEYCNKVIIVGEESLSKPLLLRLSSMNHLLHLWVDPYHPLVQVGMIPHQNIWVPRRSHEDCVHTTPNGRHKDLTDLQSNQE